MRHLLRTGLAIAGLFSLGLAGCGGGGDTASTPTPSAVSTGGTGAYAAGPISGFGSVIVGGIEFDDRNAAVIDDDGNPIARTGGELQLGMTVAVDGGALTAATPTRPNPSAVATTIRVSSEIVGRVSAVDAASGTLTVLGQPVRTNAATLLDASAGGQLSALLGQVVEVFGLPGTASSSLIATRVQRASAASAFKLRGLASAVDGAAKTLRIGGLTLSYAGASAVPATLAVGDLLRLQLPLAAAANGIWPVTRFGNAVTLPADGRQVELEGQVSGYVAATRRFSVTGVAVDASAVTILPAGLANGARAEVSGRMAGTTLVASSVKIETDEAAEAQEFEAKGVITAADPAAKTIVVRGLTFDWSSARFENGSSALLVVGRTVEVHGVLAADRSTVRATEIEFSGL